MIVDANALRDLFDGYNTLFNKGFNAAPSHWAKVAMKVSSKGQAENYSWLGEFPAIREWLGERFINRLSLARYIIENRKFELTISVLREKIEDDTYGVYGPMAENFGRDTAMHPDELVFELLPAGFTTKCYDDQYFFDTDHKGYDESGEEISVSNMQAGSNPAWYLVDATHPLKPIVYQERLPFKFDQITASNDPHVFMKDEYLYGVRGRSNAGFGLWQMGFGSKAALNEANFTAARATMMGFRKKNGKPIGVNPTHLIIPPSLDFTARTLLKQMKDNGSSNEWANAVEPIVTAFVGT